MENRLGIISSLLVLRVRVVARLDEGIISVLPIQKSLDMPAVSTRTFHIYK